MLFNSYIFILLFLPLALLLYFGLQRAGKDTFAKIVIVCMSFWFYAYFHWQYLFILLGSIGINYLLSRLLYSESESRNRKLWLAFGVVLNVGIIFYFKYFNFFLENANALFKTNAIKLDILMPLGISFFTFQQISYLVDSYRGETKDHSFLEYTLFVVFFPQLIAGPIVLHEEMVPQFRDVERRKINQVKLAKGLWWFAIGLAKKVLIADTLGKGVDWGYANISSLGALDTVMVMLLYTFQLYFDFSGYCDMASGIASMFGFDLPANFDSPYKSLSIVEFWQRWHMSLGRFLRKYIYYPLGGNRKGSARTMLNLLIVFGISGIWHGANWTFVVWGLCHGVLNVLNRLFDGNWKKVPKLLRWGMTFLMVNLLWILFRANSLADAANMYQNMLQPWTLSMSQGLLEQFNILEFTYVEEHVAVLLNFVNKYPEIHLLMLLGIAGFAALIPKNCHEKKFSPTIVNAFTTIILLVWSVVSLSGLSTFLYFNF